MRRPSPLPSTSPPESTRPRHDDRESPGASALPVRPVLPAAARGERAEEPEDLGDRPWSPARADHRRGRAGVGSEHEGSDPVRAVDATDDGAGADDIDRAGTGGSVWVRRRDLWRAAHARRRLVRSEMRRFTVRQRRRRAVWITAVSAVLVVALGSFAAAYSPLFAVRTIQVQGTHSLSANTIVDALDDQLGTPLPLVSDEAVKAALVEFPLVQSYTLQARPPHELVVRIVERTPVGVIKGDAGYTLVDAAGVALSTTRKAPKGQPVLTVDGGVDSAAFRSAGQVVRALPASVRSKVTAVSAATVDDVTLTLGGTDTTVVWGSAEDSAMKALVLEKIMKARPAKHVKEYDVSSVPSAVVVR